MPVISFHRKLKPGDMQAAANVAINTIWRSLGMRIAGWLKQHSPSYLGTYRESHKRLLVAEPGAFTKLVIYSNDPNAIFKDRGRGPGKAPPPQAMLGWVQFKGLGGTPRERKQIAFLIGRKIARKGTKGVHLYDKAVPANQGFIDAESSRLSAIIDSLL